MQKEKFTELVQNLERLNGRQVCMSLIGMNGLVQFREFSSHECIVDSVMWFEADGDLEYEKHFSYSAEEILDYRLGDSNFEEGYFYMDLYIYLAVGITIQLSARE